MSWDFSTDPDFQEQLDWMNEFVRSEIWPLEAIWRELGLDGLARAMAPLREQVKARGLWATHLPPELGGQGMGQVRLGLMHEILGTSPIAPLAFGNAAPDSGNSEILALAGTPEQQDRWLHPLLAGDLRSAFSMTEPDTPGSDPTQLRTRAVRDGEDWVIDGLKWFSSNGAIADFLIVMAVTNPDARPSQRASMFVVDADTEEFFFLELGLELKRKKFRQRQGIPFETNDAVRAALRQVLEPLGITVETADERFTTVEAQRSLTAAGRKGRAARSVIDSAAAMVLLQAWLDGRGGRDGRDGRGGQ